MPSPKSHHVGPLKDGLSVTVGNVQINDGVFDITLSLVADSLAKGAYAAAVQLLEFAYDRTTRCEQFVN